jgi:hypothetical protein
MWNGMYVELKALVPVKTAMDLLVYKSNNPLEKDIWFFPVQYV